jgi:hypothetical protein
MTKWILFVMLFTTPPFSQKPGTIKNEDKHLWTLQSSSTMEFETYVGCTEAGGQVFASVKKVANLTFRGICLCESTIKDACDVKKAAAERKTQNVPEPVISTGSAIIPTK